ncbi:ybfB [Symbiodinium sp. CCMP2456]|nr:ybfB [Symbiodinium sp. CCMP2456]
MGVAGHQLHALVAEATGKGLGQQGSSGRFSCIFYGWVIVAVCILCKIFKVQGQNNVMSYTVPHLLQDFDLSHAELGGFFSIATILAGLVQPLLGHAVDRFGARVCIPMMQVTLCGALFGFAAWTSPPSRFMLYSEVVLIFFFLRTLSLGAAETFPNTCVQQWFQRRRGRAVGVVFTFQWLGNAVIGKCVSGIVASHSWQKAALAGSAANLLLAPVSAALLRRSPEACGLQPDGWTAVAADEEMEAVGINGADEAPPLGTRKIRDLWPQFAFTFFYAVMFGGSDFYMVEMVAEAWPEDIDVALFIFGPMALTAAVSTPLVGELMDAWSKAHRRLPIVLLAAAGFVTAVATFWLTCIRSRTSAVLYGVIRGTTTGMFQSLLSAGLAFTALGVRREEIGRVLGYNQLCTLVGTGVGPFWYGSFRDVFGAFRFGLLLSALPPLMLGIFFASQACADQQLPSKGDRKPPEEATSPNYQENVVLGAIMEEVRAG